MLEEILKKESINEADLAVLVANLSKLSEADLVRFGFKVAVPHETAVSPETVIAVVAEEAPKKRVTKKK